MDKLYLVGTVHQDPDGANRLSSILRNVKPQKIGVELSEDTLRKLKTERKTLEQTLEEAKNILEDIHQKQGLVYTPKQREIHFKIIEFGYGKDGFEFWASQSYQERNAGITLKPLESEHLRDLTVTALSEKINENLLSILFNPEYLILLEGGFEVSLQAVRKGVQEFYSLYPLLRDEMAAGMLSEQEVIEFLGLKEIMNTARDDYMAHEIAQLHQNVPGDTVAIVGMSHLFFLEPRLKEFSPIVRTLDQYKEI